MKFLSRHPKKKWRNEQSKMNIEFFGIAELFSFAINRLDIGWIYKIGLKMIKERELNHVHVIVVDEIEIHATCTFAITNQKKCVNHP